MLKGLAKLLLKVGGWTCIGDRPDEPRAVIIAAPHTSNWDGFWALVYKVAVGLDIRFFAKHSLFWFPLGTLLRSLGALPLDRSKAASAVRQAVSMFESQDCFYFALAPEGTRSLEAGWKSGFYRIAQDAGVPVLFGALDYARKQIGIAGRLDLSDDVEADMKQCADFYADIKGRWPAKASPVRFS